MPNHACSRCFKNSIPNMRVRGSALPSSAKWLTAWAAKWEWNPSPERSEERRVGKECRSRRWPYHDKKPFGLGTGGSQVEDRVDIVDGGSVPLAVRASNRCWC